MAATRKSKVEPAPAPPANQLTMEPLRQGETEWRAKARAVLRPSIQAAITLREMEADMFPDLTLDGLVAELADQSKITSTGNMERMEAMLSAQAHTLDALFHRLTRQGLANVGKYSEPADRYLRLALRAQAQVRATVETLHEMKHPRPVSFVQQANIAHGPQQVNNGGSLPRTGETQNAPNELLEQSHGERLDGCTARAPAAADTGLETVGAIHRTAHGQREGRSKP